MRVYLLLLLLPDPALASSARVLTFFAGESVTFSCSDETNRIRNVSQITVIVWGKENGSHPLYYASDGGKYVSNFTDPRISFLSTEIPPMLRIRDARPGDTGNYSCEISAVSAPSGVIHKSWTLHITDPALASSASVLTFFAGESVTFSCSDETNRIRKVSQIILIVWRKENGSHPLYYASDGGKNVSNFTDPRISFLSKQIPPMLRIRDARPGDTGNYTCDISAVVTSSGIIRTSWTLHITEPLSYYRYEAVRHSDSPWCCLNL
ncbi:uncharacterized protein ACNLHF_011450 [Anomaloglossus baeobatrachus]